MTLTLSAAIRWWWRKGVKEKEFEKKREREKKNERKKGKFHILRKFQEIPIAFDGHIVRYTD